MTYDPTDHLAQICNSLQGSSRQASVSAPYGALRDALAVPPLMSLSEWRTILNDALRDAYAAETRAVANLVSEELILRFDGGRLLQLVLDRAVAYVETQHRQAVLPPERRCCDVHDAAADARAEAYENVLDYLRGVKTEAVPAIDSSQVGQVQ